MAVSKFSLQLTIIMFIVICCCSHHMVQAGLPKPGDKIISLNFTCYEDLVFNSNSSWLILYYRPWCGHCSDFYESWRLFAKDIDGWKGIVNVGAVDCDQNAYICNSHNASSVPKIRYFPPMSRKPSFSKPFARNTVGNMMRSLCQMLQKTKRMGLAKWWPNILPTNAATLKELWSNAFSYQHRRRRTKTKTSSLLRSPPSFIVLAIEIEDTYLGMQLILDFYNVDELAIFRTNHTAPLTAVAANSEQNNFPVVYVVYRNMTMLPLPAVTSKTRKGFRVALKNFLNGPAAVALSNRKLMMITTKRPKTNSGEKNNDNNNKNRDKTKLTKWTNLIKILFI